MRAIIGLAVGFLAFALSLGTALAVTLTISGDVTYRERIALPDNGILRISLVDMETPDQPRIKAEGAIASPGQVPLTFRFNLDDKVIATDRSYGLRAEIVSNGQVWFRNEVPLPLDLAATEGMQVLVSFTGTTTPASSRPAIDFSPILDVTWAAQTIGGVAVTPEDSTLSITSDMRAGGRGGCNSYFSQARIADDTIAFSALGATRMACGDAVMAQEAVFFAALESTRRWQLVDGTLELLDADGKPLMRLTRSVR